MTLGQWLVLGQPVILRHWKCLCLSQRVGVGVSREEANREDEGFLITVWAGSGRE